MRQADTEYQELCAAVLNHRWHDFPTPVKVTYDLTTYARISVTHARLCRHCMLYEEIVTLITVSDPATD